MRSCRHIEYLLPKGKKMPANSCWTDLKNRCYCRILNGVIFLEPIFQYKNICLIVGGRQAHNPIGKIRFIKVACLVSRLPPNQPSTTTPSGRPNQREPFDQTINPILKAYNLNFTAGKNIQFITTANAIFSG